MNGNGSITSDSHYRSHLSGISLNDGIIIHHMITQSSFSDGGQVGEPSLGLIIH